MAIIADTLIVLGLATANLGTIYEESGAQERTFLLQNKGDHTLTLLQGYGSCGCTTVHFQQGRQLAPNDTASVTVKFNPRGKGGDIYETATVVYLPTDSDQRKLLPLVLTGKCITSEETLMKQFPIRISDSLRLSTDRYDLGIMHVGETKERHVVLLHYDPRTGLGKGCQELIPIHFTVDATTPKGLQHIAYPVKVGGLSIPITLDVLIK